MRYVIADLPCFLWGHIFEDNGPEIMTRFVYDLEEDRLVAGMVPGGFSEKGQWWTEMSRSMLDDLEDSLKNANPDALSNPDDWSLMAADELPDWARPDRSATPGR